VVGAQRTLSGIFPLAVYKEMGLDTSDLEEIKAIGREAAAGGDEDAFRKYFRRRTAWWPLVRNMRKVALTERKFRAQPANPSASVSPP